jgi:Rrf2 family protein
MKFSTKSTYGLRAIIRLAKNWDNGNLSLATIATEENISLGYLEKLFSKLKQKDLVRADKGTTGGYSLIKKPTDISVLEIINALEGQRDTFHCTAEKGKVYCSAKCDCDANIYLVKIQNELTKTLQKIKLSELVK